MTRLVRPLACAALIALLSSTPALAAPTSEEHVLKATLSNGLQVVIVRDTLAPVISTDMAYVVGSANDPPGVPGMAHAQEHMMFRGTPNLSTSQLGTIATALGGAFNAETSDTLTQYEFSVPSSNLDAVLRIESDRMRDVLDAQSEWENERGAIEQEVLRDDSEPGNDFFRDVESTAFAGTPYAHDGVGTVAAFNRLTGPEIKAFYDRWYGPNNAVFVIAGDVDENATLAQVRSYFDGVPKKAIPARPAVHLAPLQRTVIRRNTTLTYPLAVLAFRFPGISSPDFLACYLLQQVLSSSRSALANLVDTGAALDAEWVSRPYNPAGQVGMATAALGPGADPYAMTKRLEGIVKQYASHGVPAELFATTKRQSIVAQEFGRDSISSLANDWATTIALDGEPSIKREQELLAAVTLADVNRVARRYLDPQHAIVGALTPSANASQSAPAVPPAGGPEKPLDVGKTATSLPAWGQDLVDHVTVPPAAAPAPAQMRLPNGITLIVRPAQISDSVFAFGSVKTEPSLQEPQGKEGVASVLGDAFAYGTQSRDRQAFQRAQDDIDTQIGGGTSFGMRTTSESFGHAIALLAEQELHPRLDQQTFALSRRRALEELQTSLNSTGTDAENQLTTKLYPAGDPELRRPTAESVQGLSLDDVRSYYGKIFRPDLTTIVIVGNVSLEAARAAVERSFGGWSASGTPPALDLPPVPLNQPGDVHVDAPSSQDTVFLAQLASVKRSSQRAVAMQLGNAIFGGGSLGPEQSRLFRDIRQNAGLVYSIHSGFSADDTRSQFSVSFASSPENRQKIIGLIGGEIARMQTELVGDFELSLSKAAIVRRTAVGEASLSAIGQGLLGYSQGGLPLDQSRLDARDIIATSAQAVKDAFAAVVRPDGFVKVVVGP